MRCGSPLRFVLGFVATLALFLVVILLTREGFREPAPRGPGRSLAELSFAVCTFALGTRAATRLFTELAPARVNVFFHQEADARNDLYVDVEMNGDGKSELFVVAESSGVPPSVRSIIDARPRNASPSQASPSQASPSQASPSQASPSQDGDATFVSVRVEL